MTTFVGWLKEQEGREQDPVGWFAQFWRDLDGKPRLSALPSITKHLEDRDLFRLTPGLTEAHDATMAEYRRQREGVVRAVAEEAGVSSPGVQEPLPGMERGLAGQAVDRATEAAQRAAQRHGVSPAVLEDSDVQLDRIEDMLKMIMAHLGLAITADRIASGSIVSVTASPAEVREGDYQQAQLEASGFQQYTLPWSWDDLYQQAAVYAQAHGPGWDAEES